MIQLLLQWFRRKRNPNEPRRYPFSSHKIPASAFSPAAREVIKVLCGEGYEAYIVGGAVRDLLLGITPKDFDIATNATPEQIKRCFRRAFIIGRRFRLVHVSLYHETIEVSTFRSAADTADAEGRLLSDNVYGRQADDAARRDFSANALYYDLNKQIILDYHNGVHDIQSGMLRLIGNPEVRYREDPVRMLRGIRLAQKLKIELEPSTAIPLTKLSNLLISIPKARLLDELEKVFNTGHAANILNAFHHHGILKYLWPSLDEVLSNKHDNQLIQVTLNETDLRLRQEKSISTAFILGALLWPLLIKRLNGQSPENMRIDTFYDAIEEALEHEWSDSLALPRRYTTVIKEIWQLQIRFTQRTGQRPQRLLTHPRFRAAFDFLSLRARSSDTTPELFEWWEAFMAGNDEERERLQKALIEEPGKTNKKRVRRRKKSPNAKPVTTDE
ncbi:MAG: polynucleotide adenylyltransferase PcnB [Pseudomonadota bacterium]